MTHNTLNRRSLVTIAAMLPIGYVVQGCATSTAVANFITDAEAVAAGLAGILPSIQTITGLGGGAYNTVVNAINAIKAAAGTLASETGSAAVTAANAIPVALAAISAALANFQVPVWVTTVIAAAQTVVPVIIAAVETIIPVAGGRSAIAPTGMTVAQALSILKAAAA